MVDVKRKKRTGVALAVWLLLALVMLLAPAPREWGAFGRKINASYDKVQPVLQPAAHVVLMVVFSGLLMQCFVHRAVGAAILYSLGLAVALALMLEILQSTLPANFARKCDVGDLIPSVIGAAVGCVVGILYRFRGKRPC